MPAKGSRTVRGPRFTKPKPKVRDARDPELYDDGVVAGIRQELTAHRLPLDGQELSPMPAELPMRKRLSTYSPGKLCEVALGLLAAGLERVSHIDEVKHDPGLCAALGVEQLPDQATMSRFFADATARQVQWLRARNRSFSQGLEALLADKWWPHGASVLHARAGSGPNRCAPTPMAPNNRCSPASSKPAITAPTCLCII